MVTNAFSIFEKQDIVEKAVETHDPCSTEEIIIHKKQTNPILKSGWASGII